MSKIGKKPIEIPSGVQVQVQDGLVVVKGPKGELKHALPEGFNIDVEPNRLFLKPTLGAPETTLSVLWGLHRALLRNMIIGVSGGFVKLLEMNGVGYKAVPKGTDLELSLGFSHPILYKAPAGISFKVEKNVITVTGIDKEMVGKVAAEIRALKVPEPYKGHGIRYSDEVIKKKAGKKAIASGA